MARNSIRITVDMPLKTGQKALFQSTPSPSPVHRPNRDDKFDKTVLIKTWKVKRQQLNGRPGEGYLYFDVKTNRYYSDNACSVHPMSVDLYSEREQQPF